MEQREAVAPATEPVLAHTGRPPYIVCCDVGAVPSGERCHSVATTLNPHYVEASPDHEKPRRSGASAESG